MSCCCHPADPWPSSGAPEAAPDAAPRYTIAMVGNPNSGKTTLFNSLTGANARVGNWAGVTVAAKTGLVTIGGQRATLVDLPGAYSLGVGGHASPDERAARDFILSGQADVIVNVVDAANLERNLYLTAQLVEMGAPIVVALNMIDLAKRRRLKIDADALARRIGCPVAPISASRKTGLDALRQQIAAMAAKPRPASASLSYGDEIEEAIADLEPLIADHARTRRLSPRWLAISLLEAADAEAVPVEGVPAAVERLTAEIEGKTGEDADIVIADGRYGFAHALVREIMDYRDRVSRTLSDHIDRLVLNRVLGIPIFFGVIYAMFLFTINLGGAFIDFFDIAVGTFAVYGTRALLTTLHSPDWVVAIFADGVGAGIQTVATFVPIIATLFLFLSVLEDSGYMARGAYVMDRVMRAIGLPGKSFVPLVIGFGCTVPAVMATRTLDNRRDRLLTALMSPFMSCGARLPVYALFAAAFFPVGGQNVVFALYLIGIAAAIATGFVLRRTLLAGETAPFLMELPPYRLPSARSVLVRTRDRLNAFLLKAGRFILPAVAVLGLLNSIGTDGSFGNQDGDRSVLATIGRSITPVFTPMGISEDNWPATVGLFTGACAKEAMVGTLDALYTHIDQAENGAPPSVSFDPIAGLVEAARTVPANLGGLGDAVADPLGLGMARIGEKADSGAASAELGVESATFGAMITRFDGKAGAFAYLLFVLLYAPCVSALGALFRETGGRWTAFSALWSTALAYVAAVGFYQLATFAIHPLYSLLWIGSLVAAVAAAVATMRRRGLREAAETTPY